MAGASPMWTRPASPCLPPAGRSAAAWALPSWKALWTVSPSALRRGRAPGSPCAGAFSPGVRCNDRRDTGSPGPGQAGRRGRHGSGAGGKQRSHLGGGPPVLRKGRGAGRSVSAGLPGIHQGGARL